MSERRDRQMLVVIGAMKCGTSSLHHYLRSHPQISMSRLKELNFFVEEKNWSRGFDWYRSRFDDDLPVWGESSPNYSKHPLFAGVPERMHAALPDATLVYVMRDPIERIVSHYVHNVSNGRETRELDEALADPEDNNYVTTSRYHHQLQRFLKHYDRSRLLLCELGELSRQPLEVVRRICEAVGVEPELDAGALGRVYHRTSRKRRPNALARKVEKLPGGWAMRHVLPPLFTTPLEKPRLDPELRGRLAEILKPDVDALRDLWGRDLEEWSV
jgi:hypothetical protein